MFARWLSSRLESEAREPYVLILFPVEVKWTDNPSLTDARHLLQFLDEHARKAKRGFIVCRCQRTRQLHEKVMAIPWWQL